MFSSFLALLRDKIFLLAAGIVSVLVLAARVLSGIQKAERDAMRARMAEEEQRLREEGNEAANAARRTGASQLLREGKF